MKTTTNALEISTIRSLLEEQKLLEEKEKMDEEALKKLQQNERNIKRKELDEKQAKFQEYKRIKTVKIEQTKEKILHDIARNKSFVYNKKMIRWDLVK